MVEEFASELLRALATVEAIDHVALHSEGPIVNGRAYLTLGADQFLEFYENPCVVWAGSAHQSVIAHLMWKRWIG